MGEEEGVGRWEEVRCHVDVYVDVDVCGWGGFFVFMRHLSSLINYHHHHLSFVVGCYYFLPYSLHTDQITPRYGEHFTAFSMHLGDICICI